MQVRDLIHLLQTRAKPDDELLFTAFVPLKDGRISEVSDYEFGGSFDAVFTDEEGIANILISKHFIHNFLVSLGEIDVEKCTRGWVKIAEGAVHTKNPDPSAAKAAKGDPSEEKT